MFFIARYKTAKNFRRRLLRISKVACIEAKASRVRQAHRAVRAERHQQRCRTHRGQGTRATRAVEMTTRSWREEAHLAMGTLSLTRPSLKKWWTPRSGNQRRSVSLLQPEVTKLF